MNTARIVLACIGITAVLYAAFGLLVSLRDFGVGMAVAAACFIGQDLCAFLQNHRRDRHARMMAARRRHPATRWKEDQL